MLTADPPNMKADNIGVADQPHWATARGLSRLRRWWWPRSRARIQPDARSFQPYRTLARQLLADFPCADGGRVIMISSVSVLSTEILLTLCYFMRDELGSRLLLVDATGRDDGLGGRLGVLQSPGFLDLLHTEDARLVDLIQPTARAGIALLPPGRPPGNGPVALRAARVERLFEDARGAFDYVILQQPAVLEDHGFLRFAAAADAVMLFVEEGRTGLDELAKCRILLEQHRVKDARVILCAAR